MTPPVLELSALLANMEPMLRPGAYVFVSLPESVRVDDADTIASIREDEGLSVVMAASRANELGFEASFRAAWISLRVHSDLDAVGLTAAVSTALADVGMSCNVIAGALHDHLFVPYERGAEALAVLRALQGGDAMEC